MQPTPFDPTTLDEAISRAIERHQLECDTLTEAQFADAVRQAVKAGDFIRHVRATDNAQTVIYIPGAGMDGLLSANHALREEVRCLKSFITAQGLEVPPVPEEEEELIIGL